MDDVVNPIQATTEPTKVGSSTESTHSSSKWI